MSKTKSKILILVPAFTARGGITNYYQVLKDEFPENIEYFERGARTWPVRKDAFAELLRAYKDYGQFKRRIKIGDIKLVQSTTSLGVNSIIRDGFFLRYANKKGIKTIAFFRGWDYGAETKTQKYYLNLFRHFFFFADALVVLSERTKATLKKWGYRRVIFTETTLVDKRLIDDVASATITKKFTELRQNRPINLLFLSRLEKSKGIYELIEAYKKLRSHATFKFTLTICGDGFELEPLREKIQTSNLEDIEVVGFVSGKQKKQAFSNAHIFVFPSHGEGMPNAVLEAMGFGLPVITTPVGGVIDFFEDGKNGYFTPINNPAELVEKIQKLASDIILMSNIALENYQLARERFSSDKVAKRILKIFNEVTEK
jgi:glycosyltransferase involved in cell wall biosynthesis